MTGGGYVGTRAERALHYRRSASPRISSRKIVLISAAYFGVNDQIFLPRTALHANGDGGAVKRNS